MCLVSSWPQFLMHGSHINARSKCRVSKSKSALLLLWLLLRKRCWKSIHTCFSLRALLRSTLFFPVNKRLSLPKLTALFPSPLLNLIWTKIDEQILNGRLPTNNLRSWEKLCSSPSLKKSSSCPNSDEMTIFFRNREDRGCYWC